MKRVIDVSDTLYKTCKRLVSEGDARPSECCIANSEPYEPQDDCISRSALKNYWENRILTDCSYISSEEILQSIDDAQAVETFTVEDMQNNFDLGAMAENGKHDRLKGEWKTVEGYDGDEYYECSNCGEPWFLSAGTPKDNNMNFCPNCGADMKNQ